MAQELAMSLRGNNHKVLLNWALTPWQMNGKGGWTTQPIILVEGQTPFFADHPQAYIAKLQELHDNLTITCGSFYTCIGQFKDALEQGWDLKLKGRA